MVGVVKDTFSLIALLGYLLWLNWQMTFFVAVLLPAVALAIRAITKRVHRLAVAGEACERWVLPDWYERGGYLACDASGCRLLEWPPAAV